MNVSARRRAISFVITVVDAFASLDCETPRAGGDGMSDPLMTAVAAAVTANELVRGS